MSQKRNSSEGDCNGSKTTPNLRRRRLLTIGTGVGATLLAGCASQTSASDADGDAATATDADTSSSTTGDADETTAEAGAFRLLISDRPAAIDDFDELNVSFDRARIFRGEGDDGETAPDDSDSATTDAEATGTETETAVETETETATATATETATATLTGTSTPTHSETPTEAAAESDDGEERGFFVVDLGGATVDLTQVVGDKAMGVFDGELEAGRYAKMELYAADVEGLVDGKTVDVKIPSGKLQLTKPFEVVPGETLSFVFDINVVKKGRSDAYNLLPVISESGVAGRDVEVEEVGRENGGDGSGGATETETDDGGEGTGREDGSDRSKDGSDDAAADS